MDTVHELDKKPWISKSSLQVSSLLEDRENQLKSCGIVLSASEDDINSENEKRIVEELDQFARKSEPTIKPYFKFNSTDERALTVDPSCEIKLYQNQLEHAKLMISDAAYRASYLSRLKMTRKGFLMRQLAMVGRSDASRTDSIQFEKTTGRSIEALLVVQLWSQPVRNNKLKLEREVIFRSEQELTDLRDQFKCQRDYGVPMDISERPDQAELIYRGELFKSGFFLIDATFYNDMRDPNNTNLSTAIIEWSKQEIVVRGEDGKNARVTRGLKPLSSAKMEDSKFRDLTLRLGCPYLYLHQGDCEHLFTISDIRYVSNDETLARTKFPLVTATSIGGKEDMIRCYMCKSRSPHWYTRANDRLPVDPYFFCDDCFYSFNYDDERKKIGKFQAYLYTSTVGIPNSVTMALD